MRLSVRGVRYYAAIVLVIVAAASVSAACPVEAQDAAAGGAVFKIPDGYMRAPGTEFRGLFLLDPKRPAGMFVTYANDNETTEALRQRILTSIAGMFIRDSKGKSDSAALTWVAQPLPSHPGDGSGIAATNTYSGPTQEVQVAIYERKGGPRPFLYGYFAMRHKAGKEDDGKFLDDQGKGVKAFDKLWKSFPK